MTVFKKSAAVLSDQPMTFLIEGDFYFNDILEGTQRADTMYGYGGHDWLFGYGGNDYLDGGAGDDVLEGGGGADRLVGGAGIDTASYQNSSLGVMLDLATGGITNDAAGDTFSGIENVRGSRYADIIQGDAQNNKIEGNAGDDWLFGGAGNDRLDGGEGNDVLRGGAGDDVLVGNIFGADRMTGDDPDMFGRDTFVFSGSKGNHVVTDFQRGYDLISVASDFGRDGRLAIVRDINDRSTWSNWDVDDTVAFNPETHSLMHILHVTAHFEDGSVRESFRFSQIATFEGIDMLSASDLA